MGILNSFLSRKRENVQNTIEPSNDNRVYRSITIGSQVWMAENLNNSHFRNGDFIPEAKTNRAWEKAGNRKHPAWCYYKNSFENSSIYGKLYNWYAITDPRNICPVGWHVPTIDKWNELADYLGGDYIAGNKLKEKGTTHWGNTNNGIVDTLIKCSDEENFTEDELKERILAIQTSPEYGITDKFLFSALPGGSRQFDGVFSGIYVSGNWWSSNKYEDYIDIVAKCVEITNEYSNLCISFGNMGCGFSVRCLKDL